MAQTASAEDGTTPRLVDADGVLFGLPEPQQEEPLEPEVEVAPDGEQAQ